MIAISTDEHLVGRIAGTRLSSATQALQRLGNRSAKSNFEKCYTIAELCEPVSASTDCWPTLYDTVDERSVRHLTDSRESYWYYLRFLVVREGTAW